ncbi:MAG: hypothetical protein [Olavius algarvensis Gamma 1 endosymbiont]|nr:MAG: hypothetical protein [Olavius algarvensis Gamma 1 endosymbiont]
MDIPTLWRAPAVLCSTPGAATAPWFSAGPPNPKRRRVRAYLGRLRGCLGTHFRNSLKIGRLDKINPLF